ncbi:MAG: VpsF family polysaccharide biosynthesis protein [Rhodoblastus sp.]
MIAARRMPSPLDRVADALTLLMALVVFGVSAMALTALGVAYDQAGGSALQKFHPATYIACLALAVRFVARSDPFGWLTRQAEHFPGVTYFVATWIVMVAFGSFVQHEPISPIIDTFLCTVAFLVLYADADERMRATMRLALHAFMFVNACLGVMEHVGQFRLTPYVTGGNVILHDFRSTALLGHPLINASTTAAYALILIYGGDRAVKWPLRLFLIGLQTVAMVAFGGRTAIVLFAVLGGARLLRPGLELLGGRRFDMRAALAFALSAPILIGAVVVAVQSGALDGLLERFVDDKGSAEARVLIFNLFDYFSWDELLFGPDQVRLATIENTLGIQYGIENSWFGFLFGYGLFMTLFFMAAFAALLWDIWRRALPGAWSLFFYILVLLSSAAGIAVKTNLFNQFVVLLLVFFYDWGDESGAPARVRAGYAGYRNAPERA